MHVHTHKSLPRGIILYLKVTSQEFFLREKMTLEVLNLQVLNKIKMHIDNTYKNSAESNIKVILTFFFFFKYCMSL